MTDVLTVRLNAEVLAAAAQAKLQRFTLAAQDARRRTAAASAPTVR